MARPLPLALAVLLALTGLALAAKPPPAPAGPPVPLGRCSEIDEANPDACLPGGSRFSCGDPGGPSSLVCPGASVPCRIRGPMTPTYATGTCDGDQVSWTVRDGDGALSIAASPGVLSGPVRVESINKKGYCLGDLAAPISAPRNCGSGDKLCGIAYVDVCYCSGKAADDAPLLSVPSLPDRETLPCAPLALDAVAAANSCGQALTVLTTLVSPEGERVTPVAAGATELPAGGYPSCGPSHVYHTAINPRNGLSAQVGYVLRVRDVVEAQSPAPLGGNAICSKTWKSKCGAARAVAPSGVSLDGCTLTASFPAQTDTCGVSYAIGDETLAIGGCGAAQRK